MAIPFMRRTSGVSDETENGVVAMTKAMAPDYR
jgi:hypothetical protein